MAILIGFPSLDDDDDEAVPDFGLSPDWSLPARAPCFVVPGTAETLEARLAVGEVEVERCTALLEGEGEEEEGELPELLLLFVLALTNDEGLVTTGDRFLGSNEDEDGDCLNDELGLPPVVPFSLPREVVGDIRADAGPRVLVRMRVGDLLGDDEVDVERRSTEVPWLLAAALWPLPLAAFDLVLAREDAVGFESE